MGPEKNGEETNEAFIKLAKQKKIEQSAAEIVHEIRNPLTTVKGFLELIKPYLKEIGKEQYAEVALTELNRADELIYDYLHGAKPQSNHVQKTYLNKVVNNLAMLYESKAILKNIQLITNLSNQEVVLNIPENPLKQVLINLMNNAIEAIEECNAIDRKICFSTEIDSTTAVITIMDSGGGITDENIKNLFEPFFSSKEKGTGLGLSICKTIIEDHKGSIHVKSLLEKYTTFTVCLPIKSFFIV
ncbi:ATP-binding protein [Bacillus sp. EB600]|uniref:ATP-binding protein n=1 Tax=Bacillus sp. EB600 TaxID=2806345 RepID=UPI00210B1682|nr:ATP-binding protein [Bacillus sp. EB600]MCQ6282179.1 GHKL domain-containing protein [Bacillus sp. EB600]